MLPLKNWVKVDLELDQESKSVLDEIVEVSGCSLDVVAAVLLSLEIVRKRK